MIGKTHGDSSAFASPATGEWFGSDGLTKREYFAIHAPVLRGVGVDSTQTARWAVAYADALIAELNRRKEP